MPHGRSNTGCYRDTHCVTCLCGYRFDATTASSQRMALKLHARKCNMALFCSNWLVPWESFSTLLCSRYRVMMRRMLCL